MFFLFPYGHDRGVVRFAVVVAALAAACFVLHTWSATRDADRDEALRLRLIEEKLDPDLDREAHEAARARRVELEARLPELRWAFRPDDPRPWSYLSYAFFHGGWWHLIGNLLFLWLAAAPLEDRWGKVAIGALYGLGAAAAALAYQLTRRGEALPLVGASGAVAAAMGAFLVCFATARIRFVYGFTLLIKTWWWTRTVPAWVALPAWFGMQVLGLGDEADSGVAFSAHVGGFLFGLFAALALRAGGGDDALRRRIGARDAGYREDERFLAAVDRIAQRQDGEAAALLEELVRARPEHEDAALELCQLAAAHGDRRRALALAERALVILLARQDARGAHDLLLALRGLGTDLPPGAELAAAAVLERVGDYTGALAALDRTVRTWPHAPHVPQAMLEAARLHAERLRDPEAARVILDHLIAHLPLAHPAIATARERLRALAPARGLDGVS